MEQVRASFPLLVIDQRQRRVEVLRCLLHGRGREGVVTSRLQPGNCPVTVRRRAGLQEVMGEVGGLCDREHFPSNYFFEKTLQRPIPLRCIAAEKGLPGTTTGFLRGSVMHRFAR